MQLLQLHDGHSIAVWIRYITMPVNQVSIEKAQKLSMQATRSYRLQALTALWLHQLLSLWLVLCWPHWVLLLRVFWGGELWNDLEMLANLDGKIQVRPEAVWMMIFTYTIVRENLNKRKQLKIIRTNWRRWRFTSHYTRYLSPCQYNYVTKGALGV